MDTTTTGTLEAPPRKGFTRTEWLGIMRRILSLTDRTSGLALRVSEDREFKECSQGKPRQFPWQ